MGRLISYDSYSSEGPAPGGIGQVRTEHVWDHGDDVRPRRVDFRRWLVTEVMRAGFTLGGIAIGQLKGDPQGWMTTKLFQFSETARAMKVPRKTGAYPDTLRPGVMLPLWVHAAIWWSLADPVTSVRWLGLSERKQWRSDAVARKVIRGAKLFKRRTPRYAWMAEVGLTYPFGSGGPRDIAAILLKVAMMEGHQ